MKYYALFLATILCANHAVIVKGLAAVPKEARSGALVPSMRIISGTEANVGQFPYQVAVTKHKKDGNGRGHCGGSLIHPEWVLTAAHCTPEPKYFDLLFGAVERDPSAPGVVQVNSTDYIVHENYTHHELRNDIALIKLPSPISLNDRIKLVKLPKKGTRTAAKVSVTVSGWGKTDDGKTGISDVLYYVNLTTITNRECAREYDSKVVTPLKICAEGDSTYNACKGDSGGPLVTYDESGEATQVGIVSFVYSKGCADGMPSGYVRVEKYLDWISENTGVEFD